MGERGVAAPAFLVMTALVLSGLCGLAVDLWVVISAHDRLMHAAEQAALAGATAIDIDSLYAGNAQPRLVPREAADRACIELMAALALDECASHATMTTVGPTIDVEMTRDLVLRWVRLLTLGSSGTIEIGVRSRATAVRSE